MTTALEQPKLHERNGHAAPPPTGRPRRAPANGTAIPAPAAPAAPSTTVGNGDTAAAKPASNHGVGGKFVVGNTAARGRGNQFYRRSCELRRLVVETIGDDGLKQLVQALLKQALAGDVAAARTLLAYAVGRPQAVANPDRADLDEFDIIRQQPSRAEVILALVDAAPAGPSAEAIMAVGDLGKTNESHAELLHRICESQGRITAANLDAEMKAKCKRRR
jgi:hypothetical protein